jgi:hypothetical protein
MRRELFRKAVPSVKLASQPDDQREQHAGAGSRVRKRERPADGNVNDASRPATTRGPDRSS